MRVFGAGLAIMLVMLAIYGCVIAGLIWLVVTVLRAMGVL